MSAQYIRDYYKVLGDAELIAAWGAPIDPGLGRAMFPAYAEREWRT